MPIPSSREQNDQARDLKIMIASTPKTGNTWLRSLLAAIYGLRSINIAWQFDADELDQLGTGWIAQQHYHPTPELLEWGRRHGAVFVTTMRHPGDVLVSLYHHVRSLGHGAEFVHLKRLSEDDGTFGEPVRQVVDTVFKEMMAISVEWMATSRSHMVRYESLFSAPVETLTALTQAIAPVSQDQIERAIERCEIGTMRSLAQQGGSFFRQGGSGGWRDSLPEHVVEQLRTAEPYPVMLAELGYSFDQPDPWSAGAARRPQPRADFIQRFGYGPTATSLLKAIYLAFDTAEAARLWPDAATAPAPNSFHTWLGARAEADPIADHSRPIITNIAAQLHRAQLDIQSTFPDLYGQHRIPYLFWLIDKGLDSFQLDETIGGPTRTAFADWAVRPDPADPTWHGTGAADLAELPAITNLVAYLYSQRPDLKAAFPDLYGGHRIDVLHWMIANAPKEYRIDAAWLAPVRSGLLAWAERPDTADPVLSARRAGLPALTNLAAFLYSRRPDVRRSYPDVYGGHRLDVMLWLIERAAGEHQLDDDFVAPVRRAFLDWALCPVQSGTWLARSAYLARHLLPHTRAAGTPVAPILQGLATLHNRVWASAGQRKHSSGDQRKRKETP